MESKLNEESQNRLDQEKSPYLLQHADNPVSWYPWGEEAFAKAKREDKPVFLSIGYSTCHWCHVMERESFEDLEVARLMNEAFVSVKVDREERPDIDMVYMEVCQALTGSGGWPLTIIMTPNRQPFFAATYIPKDSRFGRLGMMELIPNIKDLWATKRADLVNTAHQITTAIQSASVSTHGGELGEPVLHLAYKQLAGGFDSEFGGFGGPPKFPTPHNLLFLLRYWSRTGNDAALDMVEKTLTAIQRGGINDQIGFGFHRYSTDGQWLVPHFEKMLYDQAMLAIAYTEAFQATGKDIFANTARQILDYVLRDMMAPEGGFYSAEDADSEGEEGKFYQWTQVEINQVLSREETELAVEVYNIKPDGNFLDQESGVKTGGNILHTTKSLDQLASELGIPSPDLAKRLEEIRAKLFDSRDARTHPYKDDKILADWNGLMIAALAKSARVLDSPRFADAASQTADFILDNMRSPEGRLLHRFRDGEAAIIANLDDYAFLVYGLLELYETTFDVSFLESAIELTTHLTEYFWDDDKGGFFFTADDGESLLARPKEFVDNAVPSGNSVAMNNLLRMGRMTVNTDLEDRASDIGQAFSEAIRQLPAGSTQLLVAVDFTVGPAYEVVIAGNSNAVDTRKMLEALHKRYVPNKVVILRPTENESPAIDGITSITEHRSAIDGKATAYVCRDYHCELPTTDVDVMLGLLHARIGP